ncbi:helix-turn-helix domain-containing protein [Celerinatantimonas diazotrophica]|uniref:AraC family transcriptional regulator n=1 Tax=Celerinatantimonas diazotrophica TaxID=412034 RepID=A0A4R1JMM3_9GAMM|nr:helix-turn-helix domain-containing protein [Celerinatantimonas diazotrophica]TCK52200.1 AraC family transcriptional regulator [Celerinatantimonas diazotrophica]CAG9296095.1 HTH-type transcriptional activator RhaS [Celerinatantimonas diazotrophica]
MINQHLSCDDFLDSNKIINILPRNPQIPFPEHSHDFYELVLVKSGCAIHVKEGEATPISRGSVFFIDNPQLHHCFTHMDQLCLVNVILNPERFNHHPLLNILSESCRSPIGQLLVPENVIQRSEQILGQINQEKQAPDHYGNVMIENLLSQLAILFWRVHHTPDYAMVESNHSIMMLLNELNEQFSKRIDWEKLCDKYQISLRTLNRKMQEIVGLTPNHYLNRIRLCQSSKLLKNSQISITDIAYQCGFNDSNYFSNKFHQLFNNTPMQYRKKFQRL